MATDNRSTRHDEDAFGGRDDDDEVTVADLRGFAEQLETSIVSTMRRELASRERLAGTLAPTAGQAAPQTDPLTAVAQRAGVTPEALARAVAHAKAQEQADELRPYIAACIREELPDALDELLDDGDEEVKRNGSPRKAAPKASGAKPNGAKAAGSGNGGQPRQEPDSEPVGRLHWTERGLWG